MEASRGSQVQHPRHRSRFEAYVERLSLALGHVDRATPFRSYCAGLILPGDRKSVEPMAARIGPDRVQAAHQWLHHMVAKAEWSDDAVLAAVREQVIPAIERHGALNAWIIDDTGGFPRRAFTRSALPDNIAASSASRTIARWRSRCRSRTIMPACRSPTGCICRSRGPATRRGAPRRPCPTRLGSRPSRRSRWRRSAPRWTQAFRPPQFRPTPDTGVDTEFRDEVTQLGLVYVVGIQSSTSLWPPGKAPLPVKTRGGRGRPSTRLQRSAEHKPVSARELARTLPAQAWQTVTWREGIN